MKHLIIYVALHAVLFLIPKQLSAQSFTVAELNCENLFDCENDTLKNDDEFLPESPRKWDNRHYRQKLNNISRAIVSCGNTEEGWQMPDLAVLCEVENDSVMHSLTKRSLLRTARYDYVMTHSPDERGINVAVMYSPFSFSIINNHSIRVSVVKGMRPTRDILYVSGVIESGDTLHVFAVHSPSRRGGEKRSMPYRMQVAERLCRAIDSLRAVCKDPKIIMAGDFNDNAFDSAMMKIYSHGMINASCDAKGSNGAEGTYRYKGEWERIDHILISGNMKPKIKYCRINDALFLLTEDETFGGVRPKRFYNGYRCQNGYSDHLPLVLRLSIPF